MNSRYKQAAKEARYALFLTILYLIGWCVCAYLPDNTRGPMGFPLWSGLSCIYFPLIFTLIGHLCSKLVVNHLPLGENK